MQLPPPRRKTKGTLAAALCGVLGLFSLSLLAPNETPTSAVDTEVELLGNLNHTVNTGGGLVNCRGGDVCVEKVGDTAHVEWTVQVNQGPLHQYIGRTTRGYDMLIPGAVENVKVEVVSSPDAEAYEDPEVQNDPSAWAMPPVAERNQPVKLKTVEPTQNSDGFLDMPDLTDVGTLEDTTTPYQAAFVKTPEGYYTHGAMDGNIIDGSISALSAIPKEGDDYNAIIFQPGDEQGDIYHPGVTTLKVSGEVKVEAEETYLPLRIEGIHWKCFGGKEDSALGSADDGCQWIADNLGGAPWAHHDFMRAYSMNPSEEMLAAFRQDNTEHGLLGQSRCAPTRETYRNDLIGSDLVPGAIAWGDEYARRSGITSLVNAASNYTGPFYVAEDGCDTSAVKITICEPEKPETSETSSDKPSEPSESNKPSEAPETSEPEKPSEKPSDKPTEPSETVKPSKPSSDKPVKEGDVVVQVINNATNVTEVKDGNTITKISEPGNPTVIVVTQDDKGKVISTHCEDGAGNIIPGSEKKPGDKDFEESIPTDKMPQTDKPQQATPAEGEKDDSDKPADKSDKKEKEADTAKPKAKASTDNDNKPNRTQKRSDKQVGPRVVTGGTLAA